MLSPAAVHVAVSPVLRRYLQSLFHMESKALEFRPIRVRRLLPIRRTWSRRSHRIGLIRMKLLVSTRTVVIRRQFSRFRFHSARKRGVVTECHAENFLYRWESNEVRDGAQGFRNTLGLRVSERSTLRGRRRFRVDRVIGQGRTGKGEGLVDG